MYSKYHVATLCKIISYNKTLVLKLINVQHPVLLHAMLISQPCTLVFHLLYNIVANWYQRHSQEFYKRASDGRINSKWRSGDIAALQTTMNFNTFLSTNIIILAYAMSNSA